MCTERKFTETLKLTVFWLPALSVKND